MSYAFEDRFDYLRDRMRGINSRLITYSRGSAEYEFVATCYEIDPRELIAYGVAVDARRRDYIFDVDQLPLEPRQGDEITDGSVVCVVVPKGMEPSFQFTNHLRLAYRVHSEVIDNG